MRKLLIIFSILLLSTAAYAQKGVDWKPVEKVFGKKGTVKDDILKMEFPRSDIKVKIGELPIDPGFGLTSWVAFKNMGKETMAMGDLAVMDKELSPLIGKLLAGKIEISGIHNHMAGELPAIKYVHISGKGDPAKIAEGIKAALATTKTPLAGEAPTAASAPDWGKVESILGVSGEKKGNVIKFSVPRPEKILEKGMEMPPGLGAATVIYFEKIEKTTAASGDFMLLAEEVNPVLKTLNDQGISVVALHNHMLMEAPRMFFMHFFAIGSPEKIAGTLKAVLDKTKKK